jgi:hypothetical protein
MQITETLESAHIYNDDKARRRLNTAPNIEANITLDEIEKGVTIERLESINVPVYQYGTQITIHGTFPNIEYDTLRKYVLGYKSLFLNQNGSLGVKYVAIDGEKKRLLLDVARWSKNKWHIDKDSEGVKAYRIFFTSDSAKDKQNCIECYKSTPDDLYIGGKQAVGLMYGGYAVILGIGAIYQKNLWALITALTGIESQAEYDKLELEYKLKREQEHIEYEVKCKAERESKTLELANAQSKFIPPSNWQPFKGKIEKVGTYARIYDTYESGIALQVIKVVKRGAFLCSNIRNFKDFVFVDWQPTSKAHKCERSIDGWIITDNKPPLASENKASTPEVNTNGQDITISHNEKLNGIEVSFKTKPSDSVLNQLRELGFRWSYKSMLWYARYTPDLMSKIQAEFNACLVS